MPSSIEELEDLTQLSGRVLASLSATPQLHALFKYLWDHLDVHVGNRDIWEKGGLKERSRAEGKDKPFDPRRPADGYDYRPNVREALRDLRRVLEGYFKRNPTEVWRIDLPDAELGKGYQLRCIRVANDIRMTGAFWEPHLLGAGHPVSAVYVEQLFFYDEEKNLVFRYYDCNEEHSQEASNELYVQHGAIYKRPPKDQSAKIKPIYPYVAKGEALAMHVLSKWFSTYAAVKIQTISSRNIHRDEIPEDDSLILFGSASSNRFIRKLLERHQDVAFAIENRTRVRVVRPSHAELQRISELEKSGHCTFKNEGEICIIDFAPARSWPGILTRLPSCHTSRTPTTIFNSDFGTAAQALTDFLTDENRLMRGLKSLKIADAFPDYFQFLYCVDAAREDTRPLIHPIAWRPYMSTGI